MGGALRSMDPDIEPLLIAMPVFVVTLFSMGATGMGLGGGGGGGGTLTPNMTVGEGAMTPAPAGPRT